MVDASVGSTPSGLRGPFWSKLRVIRRYSCWRKTLVPNARNSVPTLPTLVTESVGAFTTNVSPGGDQHGRGCAAGHHVEPIAEEQRRQVRRVHREVDRPVPAQGIELMEVIEAHVAGDRLLPELRNGVVVLGADEADPEIVESAVGRRQAKGGHRLVAGRVDLQVEAVEPCRRGILGDAVHVQVEEPESGAIVVVLAVLRIGAVDVDVAIADGDIAVHRVRQIDGADRRRRQTRRQPEQQGHPSHHCCRNIALLFDPWMLT